MSEPSSSGPAAWRQGLTRNVVILGFVSLLNDAASEMIYPLLPVFLTSVLGAGPAALGMIEGIAESTASFLNLYSGYLSDRVKRRKGWVVAGYSISNIIRPLIAFAGSWVQVLALSFTDRVGKGIRTSPRDAMIADSTPPKFRGMAYGFHRTMDHGGAIVGPLLATGLLLIYQDSVSTVFLHSFIPGTMAVVLLLAGLREREALPTRERAVQLPGGLDRDAGGFRKYLLISSSSPSATHRRIPPSARPVAGGPHRAPSHDLGGPPRRQDGVLHTGRNALRPVGKKADHRRRLVGVRTGVREYAFASRQWHVWALFATYGIYFGLTEGVEKALVADLAPARLRGSAFGLYHLTVGIGAFPALAPLRPGVGAVRRSRRVRHGRRACARFRA